MGKTYTKDDKWYSNLQNNLTPYKRTCKCGHVVHVFKDKKICTFCGRYVFKDEKTEFLYRIKCKVKKNN